ncbi:MULTISPECIES: STAS domain-containing protein [Streptomyces]|uniref:STAS domain-containing protein n=1 Tax=Streptomyces TaxID=1883 RepID=UPI001964A9D2|nr:MULTISPECIES: STAS domain-containing protein [Streptomyces]QRX90141.1 STAS domain-containing protein [Streptomyces noursei]UJB40072.1 STAS domain-containing protein [Streptomyces sp. A1-5]
MTIEWHYTVEENLGVLSVAGYLGPEAAHRFTGAVGWVLARGTGPVIVDLSELRSWSSEGQLALADAARRLTAAGRPLELAAIPADGSLVPPGDCPPIPVHADLTAARTAHGARPGQGDEAENRNWRTTGWPAAQDQDA